MARVLVTRAEPGASETARRVRALGHDPVLAPLLRIDTIAAPPSLDGAVALVFTSANGVRVFAAQSGDRRLRALCVGAATAAAARETGFTDIVTADGDVDALVERITRTQPKQGQLLHIAGADLADDLTGRLAAAGFDATRAVLYRATRVEPPPFVLSTHSPQIDAVLFHSARAATAFVNSAQDPALCSRIDALCMSARVARAAGIAPWRSIRVAATPDEAALLVLLPPP